jgi:hypothetical protein
MLLSFACPKESNQSKRQPQIFFWPVIFVPCHALQLARSAHSNSNAWEILRSRPQKFHAFPKKDLGAVEELLQLII